MTWTPPTPEIREDWYRAIIGHRTLTNGTKLLLSTALLDSMKFDGSVSVPRSVLAKKMVLHPARITERLKEAVDAKVLVVVEQGRPGVTAEYQAVLPVGTAVRTKKRRRRINGDGAPVRITQRPLLGPHAVPSDGADGGPSRTLTLGTPVQSPSTTPSTSAPAVAGEEQERYDEKNDNGEYPIAACVICASFEKLGDDGTCSRCVIDNAVARTAS